MLHPQGLPPPTRQTVPHHGILPPLPTALLLLPLPLPLPVPLIPSALSIPPPSRPAASLPASPSHHTPNLPVPTATLPAGTTIVCPIPTTTILITARPRPRPLIVASIPRPPKNSSAPRSTDLRSSTASKPRNPPPPTSDRRSHTLPTPHQIPVFLARLSNSPPASRLLLTSWPPRSHRAPRCPRIN